MAAPSGYYVKYNLPFKTQNGTSGILQIYERGSSGTTTELKGARDLIQVDYRGADELWTPILESSATIKYINQTGVDFTQFFSGDDKKYFVQGNLTNGTGNYFCGWILSDETTSTYAAKDQIITLRASDGLSLLKSEFFYQSSNIPYEGRKSVVDMIRFCLDKIGYPYQFLIISPLYERSIGTGNRLTQWENINLQVDNYYNSEGESDDCYTILEKICTAFGFSLFYEDSKFVFMCYEGLERLETITDTIAYLYNQTGSAQPFATSNYPQIVNITRNQVEYGALAKLNKPLNTVNGTTTFDRLTRVNSNPSFEINATAGQLPTGWGGFGGAVNAGLFNAGAGAYNGSWVFAVYGGSGRFLSSGAEDPANPFGYIQSPYYTVEKINLAVKLSINYYFDQGSTTGVTQRVFNWGLIWQNPSFGNTMWYNADTNNWISTKKVNKTGGANRSWEALDIETSPAPGVGVIAFLAFQTTYRVESTTTPPDVEVANGTNQVVNYLDNMFVSFKDYAASINEVTGETNQFRNSNNLFKTEKKEIKFDHYSWPKSQYVTGGVFSGTVPASRWTILPNNIVNLDQYLQKITTGMIAYSAAIPQKVFDGTILSDSLLMYGRYTIEGYDGIFVPVRLSKSIVESERIVVLMQILPAFSGSFDYYYFLRYKETANKVI